MIKLFILTENDGTPCDRCGRVKAALVEADIGHMMLRIRGKDGEFSDKFTAACSAVDMEPDDFVAAPVMFANGMVRCGEDCFVAIEEREWED